MVREKIANLSGRFCRCAGSNPAVSVSSGYSAVGSAPALGVGCRVFESHYSDFVQYLFSSISERPF